MASASAPEDATSTLSSGDSTRADPSPMRTSAEASAAGIVLLSPERRNRIFLFSFPLSPLLLDGPEVGCEGFGGVNLAYL